MKESEMKSFKSNKIAIGRFEAFGPLVLYFQAKKSNKIRTIESKKNRYDIKVV